MRDNERLLRKTRTDALPCLRGSSTTAPLAGPTRCWPARSSKHRADPARVSHRTGRRRGLGVGRKDRRHHYSDGVRGDRIRRIALALALSLGVATVGLVGVGLSTDTSPAARSAAAVVPLQFGVDAANVPARLDGASERTVQGRATKPSAPLGAAVLAPLAAIAVAVAWWATPCGRGAARPQIVPRRSPQRAPPSLLLALS